MNDANIEIREVNGDEGSRLVLDLLDDAIEWMVSWGNTDQWGSTPASMDTRFRLRALDFATNGGLYAAFVDGDPAGALAVGEPNSYAPPAAEPELYLRLLVTARAHAGRGVGSALLDRAADLTRGSGVSLLRGDCYAGNGGKLVSYYERNGFTATDHITVERPQGPWRGRIIERRC